MAKAYEAPVKDEKKHSEAEQPKPEADPVTEEINRQAAEAAKADKEYLDKLNAKLKEIVDAAGAAKEKHPHHLNYAVSALKNAACQIEAQTPQGSSHGK